MVQDDTAETYPARGRRTSPEPRNPFAGMEIAPRHPEFQQEAMMGIFERNYDYGFRTEGSFRGPRRGYDRGWWGREEHGRGGGYAGGYDRSYNHGLNFDPYYGPRGASGERGWGYRGP
jgi:hypothetical protein